MANCLDTRPLLVCYTDTATGVKTTLIEHVVYQAGVAIAHAYTTQDTETIFSVIGGTITVGACAIASPDVEYITMCDNTLGDGTVLVEFIAQVITSFYGNGVAIVPSVVNYLQKDLVTPYVPSSLVNISTGECGCAKRAVLGTITDWTLLA
jgi:hypothetical protein